MRPLLLLRRFANVKIKDKILDVKFRVSGFSWLVSFLLSV